MHDKRGQSVLQVARAKSYGQSQSVVLQKNAVLQKTIAATILSVFTPTYLVKSSPMIDIDIYQIWYSSMWGRGPGHIILGNIRVFSGGIF